MKFTDRRIAELTKRLAALHSGNIKLEMGGAETPSWFCFPKETSALVGR
jgi:hypothetical protein